MDIENLVYEIWLSGRIHAGSRAYERLFDYYPSAYEIFRAEKDELEAFGISERLVLSLCNKDLRLARKGAEFCIQKDVKLILRGQKGYPARMESIPNPPYALFVKGDISHVDKKLCIGVVGTRSMSEYGMNTAYKISYELAAAGVTVVSGMALGIDSVAAVGALEAGGNTVAVLGCGLDKVYPPTHRRLMGIIAERGTLVSEYPPGTPPIGNHFPVRNRIISGLCAGTLIVEAGDGSGAMLTAREAARQGRAIFAVPGNVDAPNNVGTNLLIRDGARVTLSARDILDEYKKEYARQLKRVVTADPDYDPNCSPRVLEAYGVKPAYTVRGEQYADIPPAAEEQVANPASVPAPAEGKSEKTETAEKKKVRSILKRRERKVKEELDPPATPRSGIAPPADPALLEVYEFMPIGKPVPEDYFAPLGIEPGDLVLRITMLEMSGHVTTVPGGAYLREF